MLNLVCFIWKLRCVKIINENIIRDWWVLLNILFQSIESNFSVNKLWRYVSQPSEIVHLIWGCVRRNGYFWMLHLYHFCKTRFLFFVSFCECYMANYTKINLFELDPFTIAYANSRNNNYPVTDAMQFVS